MSTHLSRSQLGEYNYTTSTGERLRIVKGWCLKGEARKGALMGRWYIAPIKLNDRLGDSSGYSTLHDVREYITTMDDA